jgi:hypothetical protein
MLEFSRRVGENRSGLEDDIDGSRNGGFLTWAPLYMALLLCRYSFINVFAVSSLWLYIHAKIS